jgi:hypothetical protein
MLEHFKRGKWTVMERFTHPLLPFTIAAVFLVQYAGGKPPLRCPSTFRSPLASVRAVLRSHGSESVLQTV